MLPTIVTDKTQSLLVDAPQTAKSGRISDQIINKSRGELPKPQIVYNASAQLSDSENIEYVMNQVNQKEFNAYQK